MPGLLDAAQLFRLAMTEQGKANVQGLLSDPVGTLARLGKELGSDATQYASDQLYNAGAMSSVMPEVRDQAGQAMMGGLLGMTGTHGPRLTPKELIDYEISNAIPAAQMSTNSGKITSRGLIANIENQYKYGQIDNTVPLQVYIDRVNELTRMVLNSRETTASELAAIMGRK